MKTRLRDLAPYWVGSRRGRRRVGSNEILWKQHPRGDAVFNGVWGSVPGSVSLNQKQSATRVSAEIRWSGQRGMRIEVTARVISSASARYSARKWHQMAVGHRLDAFHAACAAKGAEEYCYWASQFTAVYRCGAHICHWMTTPALGSDDRLSCARLRPTLALSPRWSRAHMER